MKVIKLVFAFFITVILAACGGGGGGGGGAPSTQTENFSVGLSTINITQISTGAPISTNTDNIDSGDLTYTF